jgi:hypothetical protein
MTCVRLPVGCLGVPQYQGRKPKERYGCSEAFEGNGNHANYEEANDEIDHERCPA